jgi:hypothetical protein
MEAKEALEEVVEAAGEADFFSRLLLDFLLDPQWSTTSMSSKLSVDKSCPETGIPVSKDAGVPKREIDMFHHEASPKSTNYYYRGPGTNNKCKQSFNTALTTVMY